jgi:hypothetical protein
MSNVIKNNESIFDELNYHPFPGETFIFNEVLGLNNYKLNRDVNNPLVSYIIYE